MYDLYKTPILIGQVLLVVFLLAVLGSQIVSAQTTLPDCTKSLINLPEYAKDDDDVPQNMDIDKDDDGLIEICDLEGLFEIRNNLTGRGTMEQGCPTEGCEGFELTRDLDFTDDDSYRTTANIVIYTTNFDDEADLGWEPIGTFGNPFAATFEGNRYTIYHLMVNRSTNEIGLFGRASVVASITSIGLLDVRIVGNMDVGGLVGFNFGSITNSYATGSVSGNDDVGGLVGTNFVPGSITNSYATGSVSGTNSEVGGLVGVHSGSITQSYAASTVTGVTVVGGLVGWNSASTSSIEDSYATGNVSGNSDVGGLVGRANGGSITNSYAANSVLGVSLFGNLVGVLNGSIKNSYATGIHNLVGFLGLPRIIENSFTRTVEQLSKPTMPGTTATEIYYNWDPAVWNFGTPTDLPTLRDPPEGIRIRAKVFLEGPLQ